MKKLINVCAFLFLISCTVNAQKSNDAGNNWKNKFSKELKTFQQGDVTREYTVYLPKNISKDEKLPTVFLFHGGGGNMRNFAKTSKWLELKDKMILVFLQASEICLKRKDETKTGNYWYINNEDQELCGVTMNFEEIKFIDSVRHDLLTNYPADPSKLFAVGYSNGFSLILQNIILERPDAFAAFAGVGSIPKGAYPKDMSTDLNLYMSIGQKDEKILQHTDKDIFEFSAKIIDDDSVLNAAIYNMAAYLKLGDFMLNRESKGSLKFSYTDSGRFTLFVFEMMEGLGHAYPNGEGESKGVIMAEKQWNFFKKYESIRQQTITKGEAIETMKR